MHCQQFTLKYITLLTKSFRPNQCYHRPGLISLHYSEYGNNKHSIFSRPVYRGVAGGEIHPRKIFVPLEKRAGQSLKKMYPTQKTLHPHWCLKLVTGLSFCLRPIRSCRAPEQCTCSTPSHSPWASSPNSELRVKPYRDTPIVSFSQIFTQCCPYLQRCQSQQQQTSVHFQRFNGC